MSLPAIEVSGLSKRYVIEHESQHDNLRDTLRHGARKLWRRFRWGTGFETEEFWALRDVSFTVQPGEVVGVIGRNGAGKSTLLKTLSRITEPTAGSIKLRGRVASLLEVGTGFHPELTGRENIFLNGAILGMRRAEIRRKFDEIVAFAEVERFLDTPVKRYSSGMYVRLAFAVAAHLESEILIVDEVLAVGDQQFQDKCLGKMESIARVDARTILFVSHNLGAVARFCARSIHLDKGAIHFDGRTDFAISGYTNSGRTNQQGGVIPIDEGHTPGAPVRLLSLSFNDGKPIVNRQPCAATLYFEATQSVQAGFGLGFSNIDGRRILTFESDYAGLFHELPAGKHSITLRLPVLDLLPGRYRVDVGTFGAQHEGFHYAPDCAVIDVEPGSTTPAHTNGVAGEWRPSADWRLNSV